MICFLTLHTLSLIVVGIKGKFICGFYMALYHYVKLYVVHIQYIVNRKSFGIGPNLKMVAFTGIKCNEYLI